MAKPFPASSVREPKSVEKTAYYYGLPSQPRLVARSDDDIFAVNWKKHCSPAGILIQEIDPHHPIIEPWNSKDSSVRKEILDELQKVDWLTIDLISIVSKEDRRTPTLLITVAPGSANWLLGHAIVMECKMILQGHHDGQVIECQIKEAPERTNAMGTKPSDSSSAVVEAKHVTKSRLKLASRPLINTDPTHPDQDNQDLSDGLGASIATLNGPSHGGAKGIYLREKGPTGATLLLTCRSFIFLGESGAYGYGHGHATTEIIQLSEASRAKLLAKLEDFAACATGSSQPWATHTDRKRMLSKKLNNLRMLDRVIGLTDSQKMDVFLNQGQLCLVENSKTSTQQANPCNIAKMVSVYSLTRSLLSIAEPWRRVIGHVQYAPATGVRDDGFLTDWALVELHQDSHQCPLSSLANWVNITCEDRVCVAIKSLLPFLPEVPGRKSIEHWARKGLRLRGVVAEEELWNIEATETLVVGKVGPESHLTLGIANPAKSLVRHSAFPSDTTVISEEWAILGGVESRRARNVVFARAEDVGAVVWDMKGRVCGMINSSNDIGGRDVTYATPIGRILGDIEARGFSVDLA
ncbi:hypothetical protein S40288_01254 [Stachybotrys chartarum IBT 40288]|nr:hypothetical protein S40288_01254 [Stachybotrys chartarum IBT 40288]